MNEFINSHWTKLSVREIESSFNSVIQPFFSLTLSDAFGSSATPVQMSLRNVSPFVKIWYKWKTLPLPWRRQVLAGTFLPPRLAPSHSLSTLLCQILTYSKGVDLKGNTYWELRDGRAAELGRVRRTVKTPRSTHYGDVAVSPAWHQWLRHTRRDPPSVDEQRADVARQERLKLLAAQADARWAASRAVSDGPEMAQAVPPLRSAAGEKPVAGALAEDVRESMGGVEEPVSGEEKSAGESREEDREAVQTGKVAAAESPWKQPTTGNPGQNWQPQGWTPSVSKKGR